MVDGVASGAGGALLQHLLQGTATEDEVVNATVDFLNYLAELPDDYPAEDTTTTTTTSTGGASGGSGVSPSGGPALEIPGGFDIESAALLINALQAKITDLQLESAKGSIQDDAAKKDGLRQDNIQKIQDAAEKFAQAAHKKKKSMILGLVAKIFTAVAAIAIAAVAIALTPMTGGLSALAAVALISLVAAAIWSTVDAGMAIAGAVEGKEYGIAQAIAEEHYENQYQKYLDQGMSEEDARAKAAKDAQVVAMAVTITVSVVLAIGSLGFGAGGAASAGVSIATKVMRLAGLVQGLVNSGLGVGQGVLNMEVADLQEDSEKARAEQKELQALIMKLQRAMEEETDRMKDVIQYMDAIAQRIAELIADIGATNEQISHNMA